MSEKPRVVVVGGLHPEGKPHESMGEPVSWYAHSICGSTYGIAEGLSRHGFDAYPFKGFRDREPFDSADILFVSEWNLAEYVEENGLWDHAKKPAVLYLHSDSPGKLHTREELEEMYRGICFTRPESMARFVERTKSGRDVLCPKWLAEWGFPDWWKFPPSKESPYAPGSKNIVYAGRLSLGHKVYRWIQRVADMFPHATVWVIANVEPGSEQIEHDLARIKNVRFLGRLPHGTFQHYLYYADVALDSGTAVDHWVENRRDPAADEDGFVRQYIRYVNNCKLWDYIASGVPVVMDRAAGGDELIRETGLGTMVPTMGADGSWAWPYLEAVDRYLDEASSVKLQLMRQKAIEYMRENYTWGATVSRWVERFREVVER